MKDTLLTIFTWAGDREKLDRNRHTWESAGVDVQYASPVDEPCHLGGWTAYNSQKQGEQLMLRIRQAMSIALSTDHKFYAFTEADSLVLKPVPDLPRPAVHAFVCPNVDPRFKASTFCHFAWWMDHAWLNLLVNRFNQTPMDIEGGFPDRVLALVCERYNIPIVHADPLIYSQNELWSEACFLDVAARIQDLIFLHGVKSQEQYDRVMRILEKRT